MLSMLSSPFRQIGRCERAISHRFDCVGVFRLGAMSQMLDFVVALGLTPRVVVEMGVDVHGESSSLCVVTIIVPSLSARSNVCTFVSVGVSFL